MSLDWFSAPVCLIAPLPEGYVLQDPLELQSKDHLVIAVQLLV